MVMNSGYRVLVLFVVVQQRRGGVSQLLLPSIYSELGTVI